MLSVVLTDATVDPAVCRACCGRPRRGPGTSSPSTATRAPTTRSSCWRRAPRARRRSDAGTPGRPARRRDRGRRARPGAAAGRRRRGRHDAHHGQVSGAADDAEARAVARAVVSSSLVKAAAHGRDPNWGRIAGRPATPAWPTPRSSRRPGCRARGGAPRRDAGRARPDRLRIAIAGHLVFDGAAGGPLAFDRAAARAAMDAAGARHRARPRPGRRHRRGLRLRPHRGVRDREREYTT